MEVEFAAEVVAQGFVEVVAGGPGGGLVAESEGVIAGIGCSVGLIVVG